MEGRETLEEELEFQDCCSWLGEQNVGSETNEVIADEEMTE